MEEAICSIVMVIIMTENIEHKKFMPFILDDVFDIYSSNSGIDKNKLKTGAGDIPYITRTDRTNGIDSFVCEQDSNKMCIRERSMNKSDILILFSFLIAIKSLVI